MNMWNILGIQPTTYTAEIKKAYRSKLTHTNPEDKPEEFMALRQAYEDALQYARNPQPAGELGAEEDAEAEIPLLPADHPAFDWTCRLQNLYYDFPRRKNVQCWEELLSDPICKRIDTAAEVEDALLRFLMDHWFVPDSVTCFLSKIFDFQANYDALVRRYPKEFVDSVLITPLQPSSITPLDYELIDGPADADFDGYINTFYSLLSHIRKHDLGTAWKCIDALEASGIHYHLLPLEKTKLYIEEENMELAAASISLVYPAYDSNFLVCCLAGEVALAEENIEQALECFNKAKALIPDSDWALLGLSECNLRMGNYDEAQMLADAVLEKHPYHPRAEFIVDEVKSGKRKILVRKWEANEAAETELLELASIYIDSCEYEAAQEILESIKTNERSVEADRLFYLATAYMEQNLTEKALESFKYSDQFFSTLCQTASSDELKTDYTAKLVRCRVMESVALEQLDQLEEALQIVTNTVLEYPKRNLPLCRKAELHYELRQYQEAIDAATESLELDGKFHLPYRIRANAYYELGSYNEAYRDCCDCINLYHGDIEAYFCKINILIEVGEFKAAFAELDNLEEEVQGTQITFLRGKALEASGKLNEAHKTYRQAICDLENEDREIYPPAEVPSESVLIYRLALVCGALAKNTLDKSYQKERLQLLQDGVKKFPANLNLISELSADFYSYSRHHEAQKLYERAVELEPGAYRYAQLAGNEIQLDHFDAALMHLKKAQKMDPDLIYAEILLCAVYTCRENYNAAMKHILRAKDLADMQERPWPRILRDKAMIHARRNEYDLAIGAYIQNFYLYRQPEDITNMMEIMRIAGRFRMSIQEGEKFIADYKAGKFSSIPANRLAIDYGNVLDEMKLAAACLEDEDLVMRLCQEDTRAYEKNYYAGRFLMYCNGYSNGSCSGCDSASSDTSYDALQYLLLAQRERPTSLNNLVEIAKLFLKRKDINKAHEYATKALSVIPADFMDCGYQRSYYLCQSAEALTVLGRYEEAEERIMLAMDGRKCDFCQYSGCIDAYCAMVYLCLVRDNAGSSDGAGSFRVSEETEKYRLLGLEISPYDRDLRQYINYFKKE